MTEDFLKHQASQDAADSDYWQQMYEENPE
jgi:hypothetical protein